MRGYVLAMLALMQAGCASRDLWPAERVDPDTAVHMTVMAEPWIYVLNDPLRAADARDFLSMAVVETNRTGTRAYWLCAVSWSTVDRGRSPDGRTALPPPKIQLGWPVNPLELAPATGGRGAAGLSIPAFTVPAERSSEAWYSLSTAEVARIGAAAPLVVSLIHEAGQPESYAAWQVDDAVMSEFLKATGFDGLR